MLKIGIDPAFRKNGFAMCSIDSTDNTVRFEIMKNGFLDFYNWTDAHKPDEANQKNGIYFCIENSYLQDVSFDLTGGLAVVARKSRNVGLNMAASKFTCDHCIHVFGSSCVFPISPKDKGAKITDEAIFQAIVKSNRHKFSDPKNLKKTNQDERDAYMLALKIDNFLKK